MIYSTLALFLPSTWFHRRNVIVSEIIYARSARKRGFNVIYCWITLIIETCVRSFFCDRFDKIRIFQYWHLKDYIKLGYIRKSIFHTDILHTFESADELFNGNRWHRARLQPFLRLFPKNRCFMPKLCKFFETLCQ